MPPKSGFSRAKNVDYDDDDTYDDDDYYEEEETGADAEEMSAEDKEQMAIGTAKVREALGTEYKVKEVDIHDALWNYYYDIGKTVTYLKSMDYSIVDVGDMLTRNRQIHTENTDACETKSCVQIRPGGRRGRRQGTYTYR